LHIKTSTVSLNLALYFPFFLHNSINLQLILTPQTISSLQPINPINFPCEYQTLFDDTRFLSYVFTRQISLLKNNPAARLSVSANESYKVKNDGFKSILLFTAVVTAP